MKLHIELTITVEKKEEICNIMFTDSARINCLTPFMRAIENNLEEELSTITVKPKYGKLELTAVKEVECLRYWGPSKLQQEFELLLEEVQDTIEEVKDHLKFHDLKEIALKSRTVV